MSHIRTYFECPRRIRPARRAVRPRGCSLRPVRPRTVCSRLNGNVGLSTSVSAETVERCPVAGRSSARLYELGRWSGCGVCPTASTTRVDCMVLRQLRSVVGLNGLASVRRNVSAPQQSVCQFTFVPNHFRYNLDDRRGKRRLYI